MVIDALGIPPRRLDRLHTPGSAEDIVAQLVAMAAKHLDHLNKELVAQAQQGADNLTRVAAGKTMVNSLGILQNSATQIDILAARRADAVDRLKELIHAYRHVAPPAGAVPPHAHQPITAPAQAPATPVASARPARAR
ncbi:hypothetical protein GCM10010211_19990 [Streptomyces albospinus]|uniref:Uncharacterized protein n=1 Tax=Streptomyces albospinus TaxID=285515 RepID=A0ABQ2UZ45_9ACTN|nr:hypothetical protein [Streptomyces albospinus]GGU55298.1 hypothetical protein GCM10010211_19990 [Streptomyces albospinus]